MWTDAVNARTLLSGSLAGSVWGWVQHWGGPGLILLGIIDSSLIPVPGSMDVAVILLCGNHKEWWPYYGFMATIGTVVGGYITYRLAEKGGEETLEKKIGKDRAGKIYCRFRKHGFATVVLGGVMPPPFPVVTVLATAGALHYPARKFIAAIATGRAIRFFGVAYLASIYGQAIMTWLSHSYKPILYTLIGLGAIGGLWALIYFKRRRRKPNQRRPSK